MDPSSRFGAIGDSRFQVLWEDGERALCRTGWPMADGGRSAVLAAQSTAEHPTSASLECLAHEYRLRDQLDSAWAARPLELVREGGRTFLLLEDAGGEPLAGLLTAPLEVERFLRLAISIVAALRKVHQRDLIHKDLKPANILVNANGEVRLTGFGIASRLPRERQAPEPPETIAGTLAYMAPEQTGRMNRSIDARSDLYALGVTLYQMLTGTLPFTAADPMEWVHCHIARRPVPPARRLASVPEAISAIVMKLLAKTAEDRYQTATGVEHDLRHCLAEWERHGHIDSFPLGQKDTPDRLLPPEKLYGRAREIASLLAAFDRVVESGATELVLVSGYAGIGKSSVVNELHKMLVPPRGLFAAGKFDQYKRDIPYATLAQAFQGLVRSLLGKSDAELAPWREALREALGPSGQLMIDLIPALEPLIGPQPPVSELPPQDAQRRFQLVFRRLLGVFARPEHPLALFLDDLQWLDAATLELLSDLTIQSDVGSLLLLGAFRDNEVGPTHPLARSLQEIRRAGGRVSEIVLSPLARADVGRLVADALHSTAETATPLADLVYGKTGGNPFFTIQFLTALAEEKLLVFGPGARRWLWDLKRIRAKGYTENVVELMVGKLVRLPPEAQEALQWLAALGNTADFAVLALVLGRPAETIHAALWEAVRAGLVHRQDEAYAFLHDRVQEAAYLLIPEAARPERHLRIGRILSSSLPPEQVSERIFDIVTQLNCGAALVDAPEERERIAELDLRAGQRAKAAAAHAAALTYLAAGTRLLRGDRWERCYELTFALEYHRAECELLTADLAAADERLALLAQHARKLVDTAAVACLRMTLYTTLGRSDLGVEVCLDYLRHRGTHWLSHPAHDEVRQEYEQIWRQLGGRSIEALIDLPLMNDPEGLATLDVLIEVTTSAMLTDKNLISLVVCRMVNISLQHGNSDGSCFAYIWLGMILGPHFGDYQAGFRFGRLGYDLVEKRELHRYQARVYMAFATIVMPWTQPIQTGRALVRRAFDAANRTGDLTYAAYSCSHLITNLLAAGDPLSEVQREAENGLEFVRKAQYGSMIGILTAQLGLIRTLRGLTCEFGSFKDGLFDESRFEDPRLAFTGCWYWIRKLQARVYANDCAAALEAASRAQQLLWTSPSFFEVAEYDFYDALARAAQYDAASAEERVQHLQALASHHNQLMTWAQNCPENFADRAALVGAEIARVEGRDRDAMDLYEQAIRSARDNGFVHNEAIANERAAHFYARLGFETISYTYLRNARYCYARWGADAKVRQLDQSHPRLKDELPTVRPTDTIGTPVDQLDLATVLKVSQAVSGEIVLVKLIDTLLRTALEQAGAERGLLVLAREGEPRLEAEATTSGEAIRVRLCDHPVTKIVLPETVLHYVLRTRESVILDDASTQSPFAADPYIRQRQARSVLCLPLLAQAKLIGVLYLENSLAPHVFSPTRIAVLKLLASQAAIALENARLYRDLAEREGKIRRLVDANIVGIVIWDLEGRILEANDAFLRIVGYDRDDLTSGRLRWTELTPPEWLERDRRGIPALRETGALQPFEKEYFRKDGSRVPVLIGVAMFEEHGTQGVGFVLDLSERKRAEADLREVQTELAHSNRAATMGQLTASIAHEVQQPITAVATYAAAASHWLGATPANLDEIRQALDGIVYEATRAGGIVSGIRDLVRKAPPRKDTVDINEAVREVIELTRGEAAKKDVSVLTVLGDSLPLVLGDRVQLQQVMLNLIVNAVEAMGATSTGPRELLISTATDSSKGVSIAVSDSGPGLPADGITRVFDPFYTTKASGLGMGLSICRSIIDACGGQLSAKPNVPRGAVFQFSLPAHADNSLGGAGADPEAPPTR
ncbi:AAA family ATPase [Paraburkholderia sp. FT54]|uniref:trifunctional serine/threonine-protein kinase/ATP-binding protein/sensor histidine kinase n=1 Tax=Paraburkholderia sp. FT54 TaxID=3074437 RepID=UPI00287769F3|nr:AAA family ATPase [Paraburkholderia sp. FT54]WNC94904.1 AAA family ATPase [Paraburkholderia sp. FT54]